MGDILAVWRTEPGVDSWSPRFYSKYEKPLPSWLSVSSFTHYLCCLHISGFSACTWLGEHTCTQRPREHAKCLPILFFALSLWNALSLNQMPPQQAPRIYLSCLPSPGITGMSNFKVGDKDSNSGPAACAASTLTHRTISSVLTCLYLSYNK